MGFIDVNAAGESYGAPQGRSKSKALSEFWVISNLDERMQMETEQDDRKPYEPVANYWFTDRGSKRHELVVDAYDWTMIEVAVGMVLEEMEARHKRMRAAITDPDKWIEQLDPAELRIGERLEMILQAMQGATLKTDEETIQL